jgi:VanZ family protein
MRKICLIYWALLTVLLLASNPTSWFTLEKTVDGALDRLEPMVHFVCFTVLATLVFFARWPVSRGWLFALLVGYSAATELLQMLVPNRKAELIDFVQDVAGVATGALVAWLARRALAARLQWRSEELKFERPRRRPVVVAGTPQE